MHICAYLVGKTNFFAGKNKFESCVFLCLPDCSTPAIRSRALNVEKPSNAGENWTCTRSLTKVRVHFYG